MLHFPSNRIETVARGRSFPGFTWSYLQKVLATGPLALWTLGDASGSVATEYVHGWNGAYSNVTLGQAGIGDGGTIGGFNGTSSICNIYSSSLAGAITPAEISLGVFFIMSGAPVWTDGAFRYFIHVEVDNNNVAAMFKGSGANSMRFQYIAGGIAKNITSTLSSTSLVCAVLTISKGAGASGEMKGYLNGAQSGTTQTGLGVWAGALSNTRCAIGANQTTPSNVHSGNIGYGMIWNRAITPTETASLAVVP